MGWGVFDIFHVCLEVFIFDQSCFLGTREVLFFFFGGGGGGEYQNPYPIIALLPNYGLNIGSQY